MISMDELEDFRKQLQPSGTVNKNRKSHTANRPVTTQYEKGTNDSSRTSSTRQTTAHIKPVMDPQTMQDLYQSLHSRRSHLECGIGKQFVCKHSMPIYEGPSTNSPMVGALTEGEIVTSVGAPITSIDTQWIPHSRGGWSPLHHEEDGLAGGLYSID